MVRHTKHITIPVVKKLHPISGSSMVLLPKIMMDICLLKCTGNARIELKQDKTKKFYIKISPEPDNTNNKVKNDDETVKQNSTTSQGENQGKRE